MTTAPRFADYEPLLARALKHSNEGLTLDHVRAELQAGRALFWPGQKSVAISNEYHGREFVIWLAGGDMTELFEMEASATEFAKARGFSRMVVEDGRNGWGRALRRIGYRPVRQMVKDI